MINWKKVKADGAMPVRKKDLLVLWDLVWGNPNPPYQSSLSRIWIWMDESTLRSTVIYAKATSSIKSCQFLSDFCVSIVLIFCEPPNICRCRFYINYYHSKCTYGTEAVSENRQTSTLIHLPTVCRHNVLSAPIERGRFNSHT